MTDESEFFRATEIAKLTGFVERTVRRRLRDGTIPSVKIGGARLVSKAVLRRLLSGADPTPEIEKKK